MHINIYMFTILLPFASMNCKILILMAKILKHVSI